MAPLPKIFADTAPMITLFADASVCHQTGAAGWACWAKTEGKPSFLHGGILDGSAVMQSHDAELAALVRGVEALRERGWLPAQIMLQCDNMRPLRVIQGSIGAWESRHAEGKNILLGQISLNAFERQQVERMRPAVEGCKLIVRHIKGHSSGRGRYWVNRQCDTLAKKHMRERRTQLFSR